MTIYNCNQFNCESYFDEKDVLHNTKSVKKEQQGKKRFTGKHPSQRVIPLKLQRNFIEITLRHVFTPVNLLHIFSFKTSKTSVAKLKCIFRHDWDKDKHYKGYYVVTFILYSNQNFPNFA